MKLLKNKGGISIKAICIASLGFFSTTSCLALVGMGRVLSLFTVSLILTFIILLFEEKNTQGYIPVNKYYALWTIISIISCIFGLIYFIGDKEWQLAAVDYIPKLILYFLLYILLKNSRHSYKYATYLVKGIICGVFVNLAWAIADALIFYSLGFSITNEFFYSYIVATDTRMDMLSLVLGDIIRSGGLNGDPANIGMFAPILASYGLYKKRYWMILVALAGAAAAVSIVAFASIFIVFLIYLFSDKKKFVSGIVVLAVLIVSLSYIRSIGDDVSLKMIEAVSERMEGKTESDASDKENARAMYWVNFIPAVINTPTALLIGTGYGTASHAYLSGDLVHHENIPYDPEQTYFSTYFNCGLWGLIFFILAYVWVLRKSFLLSQKTNQDVWYQVFAGTEGAMIAFNGYHYTIYSVSMLILVAGIVLLSTKSNNSVEYEENFNNYCNI